MKLNNNIISKSLISLTALNLVFALGCGGSGSGSTNQEEVQHSVIMLGDKDTDSKAEIFKSDLSGQAISRISPALSELQDIRFATLSPNNKKLAFIIDYETDDVFELYTVNIDGSELTKISGTMVEGGSVSLSGSKAKFKWSPDSQQVSFIADKDTNDVYELYVVTASGGFVAKIFAITDSMVGVNDLAWSPDGTKIAVDVEEDGGFNYLYTINKDGTSDVKVSGNGTEGGHMSPYQWSPDSSRLAYAADLATQIYNWKLFVTIANEESSTNVSGDIVANGSVLNGSENSFSWSSDNKNLAFRADKSTDNVNELYVIDTTSPEFTVTKVSGEVDDADDVVSFSWSPNGSLLEFSLDKRSSEAFELFVVNPSSDSLISVSGELAGAKIQSQIRAKWNTDSSKLVYTAAQNDDAVHEMFTVNVDGSENQKISPEFVDGGDVNSFAWSADSTQVIYTADQELNDTFETYIVDEGGQNNAKLSGTLTPGGSIQCILATGTSLNECYLKGEK